jgi:L-ascorbate metabolism protein UlaG (beta-lactamase superfamily)
MTITWFGQSCFRIESKEGSLLIDPFSKDIGLRPPKIKDDLVLVTHPHYDHNNLDSLNPEAFVISGPGEYERKGIAVRGILSYHDSANGVERGLNTIYVIKAEEMTICHLGDLGQHELTDQQVEDVGDVDVLLIPVGGTYTIDGKEAVHIVSQIEPKIIVPMHYQVPGLSIKLDGAEKFIKEAGLSPENVDKIKLSKKLLPVEETKLIIPQL